MWLTLKCSGCLACHCSALVVCAASTWTNRAVSVTAWESARIPQGRMIQSIWEKWGLLPCIPASCPNSYPCSLTLRGQWGSSHKQIEFLWWIKIHTLVTVQNLVPDGLFWKGWCDNTKCQTASGAFQCTWEVWGLMHVRQFSFSGKVSCEELGNGVAQASNMSPACLLHLQLQRWLHSTPRLTFHITVEKKFSDSSLWK